MGVEINFLCSLIFFQLREVICVICSSCCAGCGWHMLYDHVPVRYLPKQDGIFDLLQQGLYCNCCFRVQLFKSFPYRPSAKGIDEVEEELVIFCIEIPEEF